MQLLCREQMQNYKFTNYRCTNFDRIVVISSSIKGKLKCCIDIFVLKRAKAIIT